ncbi:Conserved_hypothetical protein [Hexamita inflata]|uniref:Uncharacterized protein n=1 Tax=Hexamita inflata TaxID=28002 RepID=A0AA86V324_9EUKA|nr:Conserved hypothetical protein [Hexamita inflata]
MVNIATMCTEMMVHQLLITSQYMVELGERYSVQTPTQRFDFENFGFSKVKFAKHSQMIAVKYAKLFQKDIILLQLDETMTSFSCKKQSYAFQNLLVQHSIVARHAHDTRQVKQTCPYHDFCLQNFLSVKQISNAERDFELSAFYAAQLVYNLYLSNPDSLIVLIGKVLQVFNPQKFVFKLKESLNNFHNDFSIDFLADTFVHFASPDAAVQGGLNWSEKQACDDREQIQMQMSPQNMNMNAAYSPAYKMLKAPLADPKLFSRPPTANESAGNGGNQTPYEIELLATMMRGEGEEEY